MAIDPIPNVIDIGSQAHCDILNEVLEPEDPFVPVKIEVREDQAPAIQRFLDLLASGSDYRSRVALQFPVGGRVWTKQTIKIPKCAGPEIRGAGYKFSEEAVHSMTTTICAMDIYKEDGTGFIDPDNPDNPKPPIVRAEYTVGLAFRGMSIDGGRGKGFQGDGFQLISAKATGVGVNAAKHRYEMMSIRHCARGWSHDRFSPGANNNGGDTFNFDQCMFEQCATGIYIDSPMDLQSHVNRVGFNFCGTCVKVFQGGQLRLSNITLVACEILIQASRMESNNRHIYLQGLKCDLFQSNYRPIVYREVDLDTNADGTTSPSSRVGGTRGNVLLSEIMMAEGVGDFLLGPLLSVRDNDGKAVFQVRAKNNKDVRFFEGKSIAMEDVTNEAYKLDTTVHGNDWAIHNITKVTRTSTSPPTWDLETDTEFEGDATGEWFDSTPMIMMTGGSCVTLKESFIGRAWYENGRLAWLTTGNYGPSSISCVLQVVRCEMPTLIGKDPTYFLREMVAPGAKTGGKTWNYWKFADCYGVWDMAKPPWTLANYGPLEVSPSKFGDGVITEVEG